MIRLAVLLILLGFGTFVLNLFNYEFTILSWADAYQPWASLGLGVLGILIVVVKLLTSGGKQATPSASEEA